MPTDPNDREAVERIAEIADDLGFPDAALRIELGICQPHDAPALHAVISHLRDQSNGQG